MPKVGTYGIIHFSKGMSTLDKKNLMKWHIAAVKTILSIDEPILPAEKVNRLINYSQELNLQWSDKLLKFYLQATMGTCQIIKALSNEQMENPNRISRQSSPKSLH